MVFHPPKGDRFYLVFKKEIVLDIIALFANAKYTEEASLKT